MTVRNLLDAIGEFYPELQVSCFGDPDNYGDLVSEDSQSLPSESELRGRILQGRKTAKIAELSALCARYIMDGFVSTALGSPHKYDAEDVDQINILGALAATGPRPDYPDGSSMPYAVRPVVDGVYQPKLYTLHTHAQLKQVVADGAAYKLTCLQHFNELRNDVAAATTLQEIDAVVW